MRWEDLFLQRKASATNRAVIMGLDMPGPVEPKRDYEQLAKTAYERTITVYACINELMNTVASSANWFLTERGRTSDSKSRRIITREGFGQMMSYKGRNHAAVERKALERTEITDHQLLTLLENPNPMRPKQEYIRENVGYFCISGNSYEEFVADGGAVVTEMHNLRPDRVRVIPGGNDSLVAGYSYSALRDFDNGTKFKAESVIHRKMFHATDDWYGLSPLQVAMRSVVTDNTAVDWNLALTKNAMRPPGALIAPTVVEDKAYDRLKEEIAQTYQGSTGAGIPLMLEGGLKWQQFGFSPIEVDWLEGRAFTRVELCALYNVPPEIIGDADHKTYNSYPEARKALYMEASLPLLDMIRDAYNLYLVPLFGDRLFLDYDRDMIDAIQEDQKLLWQRVRGGNWISVNEKREMTGYDQSDHENSDVPVAFLGDRNSEAEDDLDEVPAGEAGAGDEPDGEADGDEPAGRQGANGSGEEKKFEPRLFGKGQHKARRALRKMAKRHYKEQGDTLLAHMEKELRKL